MILQFGAGNFLRGFTDFFVHELDQMHGAPQIGPVVVVQSTGRDRADLLNKAGGKYHLVIQGYRDGQVVEETHRVEAISRALHAESDSFLEHRLSVIALNHEAKVTVRLEPTLGEYRERFGWDPEQLAAVLGKETRN